MGVTLASIVYGTISILLAYAISLERAGPYRWIFVGWLAFIVPNFVLRSPMAALLLVATILMLLPKRAQIERVVLFIGMFSAFAGEPFRVPFPGINFLIELDYFKTAVLVLLIPILVAGVPRGERGSGPAVSFLLGLFVLLVTSLSVRDLPFTSALRTGVDTALLVIPAIAISKAIRSEQDLELALKALMALGAIYAGTAFIAQFIRWDFYAPPGGMAEFRWGILRVGITTVPALAGLIGVVAFIIATFGAEKRYARLRLMAFQAAMLLLMLFTFSRGAWVAGFAGLAVYMLLTSKFSNASVVAVAAMGAVGGLVAGTSTLLNFDPYGTFSYRAELLKAAGEQFWDAPFFGSPNYLESGRFDHLWTGMGLIDVVNYYVQLTMEYGAVGLTLYLAPFLVVMAGLLRYRVPRHHRSDVVQIRVNRTVGILWACLSAYIVLIMTISGVSYIIHFGYILLGLSMGAIKVAAGAAKEGHAAPAENIVKPKPAVARMSPRR